MKQVLIAHEGKTINKQSITDECFLKLKNKIEDMYIEEILLGLKDCSIKVELLTDEVLIINNYLLKYISK